MNTPAPWIEGLARLGYACVGVVYAVIGFLAIRSRTPDKDDAFAFILDKPFGRVMLFVITAGLIGYALWRVICGVKDAEHRGIDAKGMALRAGSIVRGIFYAGVAFEVARFAMHGHRGGSSDANAKHWTGRLMDAPFGRWLAAAAGLTIIGAGIYQLTKAWKSELSKQLRLGEMKASVRKQVVAVCRFGLAARGVVFGVIGYSILRAAIQFNPNAAKGTSGALRKLAEPMNGWLLVLIGIGFMAYGVYAFVNARYRRITP